MINGEAHLRGNFKIFPFLQIIVTLKGHMSKISLINLNQSSIKLNSTGQIRPYSEKLRTEP